MSTKYWIRTKDGYLTRGLPGGKPGPYECVREDIYKQGSEDAERYWALYGLKRSAPIIDEDDLDAATS